MGGWYDESGGADTASGPSERLPCESCNANATVDPNESI